MNQKDKKDKKIKVEVLDLGLDTHMDKILALNDFYTFETIKDFKVENAYEVYKVKADKYLNIRDRNTLNLLCVVYHIRKEISLYNAAYNRKYFSKDENQLLTKEIEKMIKAIYHIHTNLGSMFYNELNEENQSIADYTGTETYNTLFLTSFMRGFLKDTSSEELNYIYSFLIKMENFIDDNVEKRNPGKIADVSRKTHVLLVQDILENAGIKVTTSPNKDFSQALRFVFHKELNEDVRRLVDLRKK